MCRNVRHLSHNATVLSWAEPLEHKTLISQIKRHSSLIQLIWIDLLSSTYTLQQIDKSDLLITKRKIKLYDNNFHESIFHFRFHGWLSFLDCGKSISAAIRWDTSVSTDNVVHFYHTLMFCSADSALCIHLFSPGELGFHFTALCVTC